MKYILIDTCMYEKEGFDFSQGYLKIISDMCANGEINLLIHELIINEVGRHICERTGEFFSNINEAKKKLYLFRDQECVKFLKKIDKNWIDKNSLNMFNKFLEITHPIELQNNNLNIDKIIKDYCLVNPPFGFGKKKEEFPDAIILNSFDTYRFAEEDEVFILSTDEDWKGYFNGREKVRFYSSFYTFMKQIYPEEYSLYTEKLQRWCIGKRISSEIINKLNNELSKKFDYLHIDFEDIYDNNSEILSFSSPECIYVNAEEGELHFQVYFKSKIDYEAALYDYDNAIYDREDNKYYNLEYCYRHYNEEVDGVAVISMKYTVDNDGHIQFKNLLNVEIFQFDTIDDVSKCEYENLEKIGEYYPIDF